MHLEALRSYFRLGDLPPELEVHRSTVLKAKYVRFEQTLPGTVRDIYGARGRETLSIPEPTAIEDELSCIILWDAERPSRGLATTKAFIQVGRVQLGEIQVFHANPQVQQELEAQISALQYAMEIDWGFIRELRYNPARGEKGYDGELLHAAWYVADPETGALIRSLRNTRFINQLMENRPRWKPIPGDFGKEVFTETYLDTVLRAVVLGIEQYALLHRTK